jgi:hypothetical protein
MGHTKRENTLLEREHITRLLALSIAVVAVRLYRCSE